MVVTTIYTLDDDKIIGNIVLLILNKMSIHITLKGNQISTQHAYGQRGKIRYMKKDAKSLKDSYILQAKMQYKGKPIKTSLSVYIRLFFNSNHVRDWDNWHKLSMDSLSNIIYDNDSQVKLATIQMMPIDKEAPRIELIFDEL